MMVSKGFQLLQGLKFKAIEHAALSASMEHAKFGKLFGPYVRIKSPSDTYEPISEAVYPVFDKAGISTNAIGRFLTSVSSKKQVVFYAPTPPTHVIMDTPDASFVAWSDALKKEYIAISSHKDGAQFHDPELVNDIQKRIREALPRFPKEIQNIYEGLMEETIGSSSDSSGLKL